MCKILFDNGRDGEIWCAFVLFNPAVVNRGYHLSRGRSGELMACLTMKFAKMVIAQGIFSEESRFENIIIIGD